MNGTHAKNHGGAIFYQFRRQQEWVDALLSRKIEEREPHGPNVPQPRRLADGARECRFT